MNRSARWIVVAAIAVLSGACAPKDPTPAPSERAGGVVLVTARGLSYEAPQEIESGWTTFRFVNESDMTHFAIVERLPEGIGVKEQQEQVAPVFQEGMNLLAAGNTDAALKKFGELPEWFGRIVFMGGPGLTSPHTTAQTTVHLEPGTYLLECYVKTGGVFHSYSANRSAYGMVHQFTVAERHSGEAEPEATAELTLSSARGIEAPATMIPGVHTIAVHFEDQTVHENFVGHDVHLVRLKPDTDVPALAAWMDWRQPTGLSTPAPAEFLGGVQESPAGTTGYMTVRLEPGDYAWISEVPDPDKNGMFQPFHVGAEEAPQP